MRQVNPLVMMQKRVTILKEQQQQPQRLVKLHVQQELTVITSLQRHLQIVYLVLIPLQVTIHLEQLVDKM